MRKSYFAVKRARRAYTPFPMRPNFASRAFILSQRRWAYEGRRNSMLLSIFVWHGLHSPHGLPLIGRWQNQIWDISSL